MATVTVTTAKAFGDLQKHADTMKNDEMQTLGATGVGDMPVQGDVGFLVLAGVPEGAKRVSNPSAQLAPGNTQGSRHCLTNLSTVTLYEHPDPTPLDGPIIDAPDGCVVEHPEHGDWTLPTGVYAVVFQRAFANELRRVQD